MSYFITGTDTGVGKTLVSCALLHAFAAQGRRVVGMKPVAAGCDDDEPFVMEMPPDARSRGGLGAVNDDVSRLRAASNVHASLGQINPYSFHPAIAPHLAARQAGVDIDLSRILISYRELSAQADVVVVEGAGGFRVPLNDREDMGDLARLMDIPVILVVGMRLGCLNHALLTASAIKDAGLECAAWVANVLDEKMPMLADNVAALQQRIEAPLLGVVPYQMTPDVREVTGKLNLELLGTHSSDG